MIVHRGIPWMVIATLVLLACVSSSTSVKLRKLRKRPATTRAPYQHSRIAPVIIKVIHNNYADDEFAHGVPSNCTRGNCGKARAKFSSDIDETLSERDNFLPDEESFRYIVYPKKYEHFVSRKHTGHRYRRDAASNATSDHTVMIDGDKSASSTLKNANKRKLKKITLQKASDKRVKIKDPSKSSSRTKRNLGSDYLARRNASDYYAQRRAVMERYYARQREINARYANRTVDTRLRYNGVSQVYPATHNATRFRIEYGYPNKNSTMESTTPRYPRITLSNRIPTGLNNRRDIIPENDLDSKSDADSVQNRSTIERNALNYITTTPCGPTSGTFASKTRQKSNKNCEQTGENSLPEEDSPTNSTGIKRWGECKGKLVYQHNLLLGLTGPSNLDTIFEVIIDGSVCITCVETLRYNETRAKVTLISGGRGFEFAKLKLEGYENEGFSYIIKVWGVKKVGRDCGNVE